MTQRHLPVPLGRVAEPGDVLFAWIAIGNNTTGRRDLLYGHLSAKGEVEALRVLKKGLDLQDGPPEERILGEVDAVVWAIPAVTMAKILEVNGYSVLPPEEVEPITKCKVCSYEVRLSPFAISENWTCPQCKAVNPRPK